MKKNLLIGLSVLMAGGAAMAENRVYEPSTEVVEEYDMELTGAATHASANGRYVSIGDEYYIIGAIWCIDDPETFTTLPNRGVAYGISNDGVAVGTFRLSDSNASSQRPGVFRNGGWTALPLHDNVLNDGQTAEARCITPDGKYIAGHMGISMELEDEDITGGAKIPCLWTLDEATDRYKLTAVYTDSRIQNQGMFTMSMNDDASIIAGMLTCGAGSSTIPAMIKDGELVIWNELETRMLPWIYKGNVIGYSEGYFIDGHKDLTGFDFTGSFRKFDTQGLLYGYRTVVTDIVVDEEGGEDQGTLTLWGFVYDPETDTFTHSEKPNQYYMSAYGEGDDRVIFTSSAMLRNGQSESVLSALGVSSSRSMGCVYAISNDGKTLAASTSAVNAMTGDTDEYPMVIVLDEPVAAGVVDLVVPARKLAIVTSVGRISVAGAENVSVYDLNGRLMSTGPEARVPAGVYIVEADGTSSKVLVK